MTTARASLWMGILIAAVSTIWFAWRWRSEGRTSLAAPALAFSGSDYVPRAWTAEKSAVTRWERKPATTSEGESDLFTAPEVYFDPASGQFERGARMPTERGAADAAGAERLQLIAVERELYRLQLIGVIGGEERRIAVFEDLATGSTLLGGRGQRVADVLIEDVVVHRTDAVARLQASRRGEDVELSTKERAFTGRLVALVRKADADDAIAVHEGETLTIGDATIRVERLQLTPPSLTVTFAEPENAAPASITLTPARTAQSAPNPDSPSS